MPAPGLTLPRVGSSTANNKRVTRGGHRRSHTSSGGNPRLFTDGASHGDGSSSSSSSSSSMPRSPSHHQAHIHNGLPGGMLASIPMASFSRHPSRYSISSHDSDFGFVAAALRPGQGASSSSERTHRRSVTASGALGATWAEESGRRHSSFDGRRNDEQHGRGGGGGGGDGGGGMMLDGLMSTMSLGEVMKARVRLEEANERSRSAVAAQQAHAAGRRGGRLCCWRRWQWLPRGPTWRHVLFRVFEADEEATAATAGPSSVLSRLASIVVLLAIIASCLGFVVESMPGFRTQVLTTSAFSVFY